MLIRRAVIESYIFTESFYVHPRGYRQSTRVPILRRQNHCPHCLCGPCVIELPPDFLRGACGPHPANAEKRHRLYQMFWGLLQDLGVWRDEEYLRRKETRTVRDDKRDIMPACVLTVSNNMYTLNAHKRRQICIIFNT